MKRLVVLGTVFLLGTMSIGIAARQAPPAGPTPAALAATKIEKVRDNLYVITGSGVEDTNAFSGGNTAVFITDNGVVLIDTKLPGWGPTILERIRSVTNKPVTTIINTHTHSDHTGGNMRLGGGSVQIVVHENTKTNLTRDPSYAGANAKFLPTRTFKDKMTLGAGKDQIDLYYFGRGHTNGDTFVVFPAVRTMHVGDMFAWKALPYIDADNGGSVVEHPQSLAKAVATIKNVDTIITGHTPVVAWKDLVEFADFTKDFVSWAQAERKAGKSVDQAASEYKVPGQYKGYKPSANPEFGGPKQNLEIAYRELAR